MASNKGGGETLTSKVIRCFRESCHTVSQVSQGPVMSHMEPATTIEFIPLHTFAYPQNTYMA